MNDIRSKSDACQRLFDILSIARIAAASEKNVNISRRGALYHVKCVDKHGSVYHHFAVDDGHTDTMSDDFRKQTIETLAKENLRLAGMQKMGIVTYSIDTTL